MEGIRERLQEQENKNPGSLYLRLLGNLEVTRQFPTHNRHSLYRNSLYSTLVGAYPAYAWTFPEAEYASLVRQSVLLLDAQKQHTALFLSKKQNVPFSDCYTQWALVLSTRNSKTFAPFSYDRPSDIGRCTESFSSKTKTLVPIIFLMEQYFSITVSIAGHPISIIQLAKANNLLILVPFIRPSSWPATQQ